VLLRLAQLDDMPRLIALIRRVVPGMVAGGNNQWNDRYPNEQVFGEDIEAGDLWIAETEDGSLAGVVALTTAPGLEYAAVGWDVDEPAVFTHRLAVDPEQRGKGIAAALMQQAEVVARGRGIGTLRVDTGLANVAAQRLIVRAGYGLVGEIPLAVRPGLRVLCYERRLGVESALVSRRAAIALGSNLASALGMREDNLREAVRRVAALGRVAAVSSFYETAPVGYAEQPDFLNAALVLETALEPLELMRGLLAIERAMGRDRSGSPPKGPRIVDLDLLLVDDLVLSGGRGDDGGVELTLPHPALGERRFVLEPLAEIAPGMRDPATGLTVAELLRALG
jgi:2-amino-4-hydroxy-6-hydroxymethyldihydropteridine diphosphokinase